MELLNLKAEASFRGSWGETGFADSWPCLTAKGDPFKYVRRQSFWNQELLKLRESLAHLVGLIMRLAGGGASVAFRASFV